LKARNSFVRSKAAHAATSVAALFVAASVILGGSAAMASTLVTPGVSSDVATATVSTPASGTVGATSTIGATSTAGASSAATVAPTAKPKPKPKPIKWKKAQASCYGASDLGSGLAGGGRLKPGMFIVANKTLPFGTKIEFSYHGKKAIAIVKDRGPYVGKRVFDLAQGIAKKIGFYKAGIGVVKYRIISYGKKKKHKH
jgi:rare lipoprotein A